MKQFEPPLGTLVLATLSTLIAVLLFTRFGGLFSLPPTGISAFWPANALLFSAAFMLPKKYRRITLFLALPTYFLAEMWIGYPLPKSVAYSFANVAEVAVLLWLLRKRSIPTLTFDSIRNLFSFLILAFLASPVGGTIGSIAAAGVDSEFITVLIRWSLADFFGYCLFAPLVLSWGTWRQYFPPGKPVMFIEFAILLTILSLISALSSGVFGAALPLGAQFLPMPVLLWAALRFGPPGGAVATAIAACIAFFTATHGVGLFSIGSPEENLESLQIFFASLVVSVMTIASLNAERRRSFDALWQEVAERRDAEEALRQSEEKYRTLVQQIQTAIVVHAADTHILIANSMAQDLLGLSEDQLLGKTAIDSSWRFLREDGSVMPWDEYPVNRVLTTRSALQNYVVGVHRPNHEEDIWALVNAIPVFNEAHEIMQVIINFIDISESKHTQEELQRYRGDLEDTVRARTEELRLARDAAEAANKAKSVFLANMSHELRTPLNAILGFSQLMRRDSDLSSSQRQTLDVINSSGEHLLKLINDVLEIAKIEAGKLQLEITPFDLYALVREVTEMMRLRAQQKGLQLELSQAPDLPRYIKGDEARLRQILVNLVSNAVKFTEKGGITIHLGVIGDVQRLLLIEVEDSGSGVSEAEQQLLFKPFEQLSASTSHGGTGLGLAIVRQFVQLMDGSITVESTPGKGSLFSVTFPLQEADETEIARLGYMNYGDVTGLAPGQPAFRILIAEDQRDNRLLMAKLMADLGLEVKVAVDGRECIAIFKEWKPDLIWMDQRMPVMDGVETTRIIRQLPGGDMVKIVAVTASAFREQQAELSAAGMDDYVRKPYRLNEIYDSLAQQLGLIYTYRDDTSQTSFPEVLEPRLLAELSETQRNELRTALESLDRERIHTVIKLITASNTELGHNLTHFVDMFDYPSILNALNALAND